MAVEDKLPNDEVMRQMAALATENATEALAQFAEQFAKAESTKKMNGSKALEAFAASIRENNRRHYPKPDDSN